MNPKSAVVGLAFAVLAIGGYQFIYQTGIWRPNANIRSTINDSLARADRITAQQAKADIDALLARAEKGERLDRKELQRLIEAAAADAGAQHDLWKLAETKSRGQIVAPPAPVVEQKRVYRGPAASSPTAVQPVSGGTSEETSPVAIASPVRDSFFGSKFEFDGRGSSTWMRIQRKLDSPFALQIGGEFQPADPYWMTKTKRTAFDYRGVPFDELQMNAATQNGKGRSSFDVPDANYFALIGRYCNYEGCELPFALTQNPFVVCPKPGSWLELKINSSDDFTTWPQYRANGAIILQPIRSSGAACSTTGGA